MKRSRGFRPGVEHLEHRWCPAFYFALSNGTLLLGSGTSSGGVPASDGSSHPHLTIQFNPGNSVTVTEGTATPVGPGTFLNVTNINVRLATTNPNGSITEVQTQGNFLAGTFAYTNAGTLSDDTVSVSGPGGGINASFNINTGGGDDSVSFDQVTMAGNSNLISMGAGEFDELNMNDTPFPGNGSLTVTGAQTILIDSFSNTPVTITGNVTLANSETLSSNTLSWDIGPFVTINGNLAANSTNAGLTDAILLAGHVGGGFSTTMGNGDNIITIDGTATVGGNANITAGAGTDFVSLVQGGSVNGIMVIQLGNGDNTLDFEDGFFVGGNQFNYMGGSGTDFLFLEGQAPNAKLTAYLLGGDDFVVWGNGSGSLAFKSAYVDGGTGDDTFFVNDMPDPFDPPNSTFSRKNFENIF